jgi:hypothetical protein
VAVTGSETGAGALVGVCAATSAEGVTAVNIGAASDVT